MNLKLFSLGLPFIDEIMHKNGKIYTVSYTYTEK